MEIRPSVNIASQDALQHGAHDVAAAPAEKLPAEGQAIPTYSNSMIRIAAEAGLAVIEMRDGMNGEVRFQYPAEHVVREYESHAGKPAPGTRDHSETGETPSIDKVSAPVDVAPKAEGKTPPEGQDDSAA